MAGIVRPFFKTVLLAAAGIFIYLSWMTALSHGDQLGFELNLILYSQTLQHLAGLATLLILAIPYCIWVRPLPAGRLQVKQTALFTLGMLAIYLTCFLAEKVMNVPGEAWVKMMLSLPALPLSAFVFTVILLAPLSEEIVFRGVLLNIFITRNPWTGYVGAVLISAVFAMMHTQYHHLTTYLELFGVALLLNLARLRSGGLLLPVLLHAEASVIALLLNL
ncbi:CPBP family intramembrane glutamic endopeptidase [Pantoea deleyi]|nr:CPBP family intramembrane glutamic endopeptidase [Pantoea deleyi]